MTTSYATANSVSRNFGTRKYGRQSSNRNRGYVCDYVRSINDMLVSEHIDEEIERATDWGRWYCWSRPFEWNQHRYGLYKSMPDFSDLFIEEVRRRANILIKRGCSENYILNFVQREIDKEGDRQYIPDQIIIDREFERKIQEAEEPMELPPPPPEIVLVKP